MSKWVSQTVLPVAVECLRRMLEGGAVGLNVPIGVAELAVAQVARQENEVVG